MRVRSTRSIQGIHENHTQDKWPVYDEEIDVNIRRSEAESRSRKWRLWEECERTWRKYQPLGEKHHISVGKKEPRVIWTNFMAIGIA